MAKAVYLNTNLIVFDVSEGVQPHVTVASELKGSFFIEKNRNLYQEADLWLATSKDSCLYSY